MRSSGSPPTDRRSRIHHPAIHHPAGGLTSYGHTMGANTADTWWARALRSVVGGRRVILAGSVAAAWTEHLPVLRDAGATELLVVATEGAGVGPPPDVPTVVVTPPPGLPLMDRIHFANRALEEPSPAVVEAVTEFDPDRTAVVIGTFLNTASHLDGRPFLAYRRAEWVALEDKVVVDAFWDRAGVARQPSVVVPLADAAAACAVTGPRPRHGVGGRRPRRLPRRRRAHALGDRRAVGVEGAGGARRTLRPRAGDAVRRRRPVLDPRDRAPRRPRSAATGRDGRAPPDPRRRLARVLLRRVRDVLGSGGRRPHPDGRRRPARRRAATCRGRLQGDVHRRWCRCARRLLADRAQPTLRGGDQHDRPRRRGRPDPVDQRGGGFRFAARDQRRRPRT